MIDEDSALVARLKIMAPEDGLTIYCKDRTSRQMNVDIRQAADRIDALLAEIERLREALQKIAYGNTSGFPGIDEGINETFARELMACREVARAALGGVND